MATSSISTGCFVFKPDRTGRLDEKKVFRRASSAALSDSGSEYDAHHAQWQQASRLIHEFRGQIYKSVFDEIITMLKKSPLDGDTLPTAVLISGVNLPDHQSMYSRLCQEVRAHVTERVCLISGAESGGSLRVTVRAIVSQLVAADTRLDTKESDRVSSDRAGVNNFLVEDDDVDDEDDIMVGVATGRADSGTGAVNSKGADGRSRGRGPSTMPALVDSYQQWLQRQCDQQSPSKQCASKRRRADSACKRQVEPTDSGHCRPPLVVIFQDLEAFTPSVLQDVVLICSHYRRQIPLALVFGVATSVDIVHRLLPHHVSANLTISSHCCHTSSRCLQLFIDKVLLSDSVMFRLGGRVLRLLLDIFLYNDFSINNFISGYQYCMLEHFLSSPGAVLCWSADSVLLSTVDSLSSRQLQQLQQLPSVVSQLKSLTEEERASIQSEGNFRSWLVETLLQSRAQCKQSLTALRCLFAMTSRLPGHLLGHQFRELYGETLLAQLHCVPGVQRCWQLLAIVSKPELLSALQLAIAAVSDEALLTKLRAHLESVQSVDETAAERESDEASEDRAEAKPAVDVRGLLRGAKDRHSLKQRLQTVAALHESHRNAYERLRHQVLADLRQHFEQTVTQPCQWPLHEVFVFDDVAAVRRRIVGAPRLALQTALADPARYLQCECCQSVCECGDSISATLPDLNIVYKLHQECGAIINMFDWLQSFQAVIDADTVDTAVQARFARAVAELQFLGFIRPTRRKTDHVARLTWGSC